MQLQSTLIISLATLSLSLTSALNIPIVGEVDVNKDTEQYRACKAANPDTTFAAIRYGSGPPETVVYNQCVPWRRNGEIIANAVFCQPATCYVFSDENCTSGPTTPVPVVVPVPVDFLNAADLWSCLDRAPTALLTRFLECSDSVDTRTSHFAHLRFRIRQFTII
ncbi:hypothetical protein NLJ89_g4913 [Agrocybe chaxingu]|uniref:Uncharacterized protein n=1 Tax=Agrocybe chaxingu TaxID=84603 RepID=A0A9W8K382_9AGAR|nr:hypothetical protein NLJ89_g4913 [Agrocybe chaxingu]